MAKQIKAYVDVEAYVEVSQGRGGDPAALLSSVLVVDAFGDALARLAEAASGASLPARILSGPHGVGKSTALTLLHTLAAAPGQRPRATSPHVRTAASYLSGVQVVPIFVDPHESGARDLESAMREGFEAAAPIAEAAGVLADEWGDAAASDDPFARALAILPAGTRLVVVVDGLSAWARTADREAVRRAVAELTRAGERAADVPLSILLGLDERSLDGREGVFLPLLGVFQVEYLPLKALAGACDRFLFKKDPRQRAELGALYDDLKRAVPTFAWSRDEFVSLYPLHPATLEVASPLGRYAPSFSFLRFAAAAANRAKGRRDLSLIVLDELFDACEYEMRKSPEMSAGFEIYDDFANGVIPKLADSQQRFWAKLVLKGLFLYSLAGRAVTARRLADTMMLYDEASPDAGGRSVRTILTAFEERASQRFVVEGEGEAREYLMPVTEEHSGARIVAELARAVAPGDPRLGALLVELGAHRFPDWPRGFGVDPAAAGLDVAWRGTRRQGRLSYRVPVELVEIPPLAADLPLGADPAAMLAGDLLDLSSQGAAAALAESGLDRLEVTFEAAGSICELDWEVSVVPVGAPIELRKGPATLVSWIPGEAGDGDLEVLKRLAALRAGDPRLDAPGIDAAALEAEAEAEGGLVFHRLYLEKGRFAGPSWETPTAGLSASETLGGLLARLLDAPLAARYPQHPLFGGEIDEAAVRLLVEEFFGGAGPGARPAQQAAAAFASPLGLAESAGERGPLRFNPGGETALGHPCNVEPLRLAEAAGEGGVPLDAVYQTLRREPYGLQRDGQRLILAAMVASGRLELTGPDGELTAEGLAAAPDLGAYTRLRRAGLTVYTTETLLEWCRMLTEADHLNDLVTHDGRLLVRRELEEWLERWGRLDLKGRLAEVPPEAATRRTWQLISASKQFFETTARSVRAILGEEIALEEGLGRIVTTFAANPTIYERALRDLRMLTGFVDWVPFYTYAKEYILTADRTAEPKIEAERGELLDFIAGPHRLLDESKRRRFEAVYETFLYDYVDYYVAAHELHVGSRADFEALDAYLDGPQWLRFELLSHVHVVSGRYYQFAGELVETIRDLACELPAREILHDRPSCVCGFRLGHSYGVARLLERLRLLVDQGTAHHVSTIAEYRQAILAGMRAMEAGETYADASTPLIALLSGNDEAADLTPSAVELINRCLADRPAPVTVAPPPSLEPGRAMTKGELRSRLARWLEELPGDGGMLIEIGRALPAATDE